jgi:C-terminal processing protease CtpA/Prc
MNKYSAYFLIIISSLFLSFRSNAKEVTPTQLHQIFETIAAGLTGNYPIPKIAQKYASFLKANEKNYRHLEPGVLAARLTQDLRKVHNDVHLRILEHSPALDAAISGMSDGEDIKRNGYGFKSVELDNKTSTAYINIPYGFNCTQEGFEMAGHAMNMAAYSKNIIIDLRNNGGGAGGMGHFLASYFFEPGEEIFYLDGYEQKKRNLQEYTYGYVPGKRLSGAKLFILVNKKTGSASEGFAFAMQNLHKATIVGDTTAGAGIAGGFVDLAAGLFMFLPVKMIVAPGTDVGWEGTGVIPDVVTEDADALERTRELILTEPKAKTSK